MSAPLPAPVLNGQPADAGGPRITTHDAGDHCAAVCPVHGTDHADEGGWAQVHTPLHPGMTAPFRGRSCVTKVEFLAWRRGRS